MRVNARFITPPEVHPHFERELTPLFVDYCTSALGPVLFQIFGNSDNYTCAYRVSIILTCVVLFILQRISISNSLIIMLQVLVLSVACALKLETFTMIHVHLCFFLMCGMPVFL